MSEATYKQRREAFIAGLTELTRRTRISVYVGGPPGEYTITCSDHGDASDADMARFYYRDVEGEGLEFMRPGYAGYVEPPAAPAPQTHLDRQALLVMLTDMATDSCNIRFAGVNSSRRGVASWLLSEIASGKFDADPASRPSEEELAGHRRLREAMRGVLEWWDGLGDAQQVSMQAVRNMERVRRGLAGG